MSFPKKAYTNDEALGALVNAAAAAGLDISGLSPINAVAAVLANLVVDESGTVPAAKVAAGSFGAGDFTITGKLAVTSNVGFNGTTPIAKPLLATGAEATVDDVITVLQNYGLVKQS